MKISFKYSIEKDTENFIKSFDSTNSQKFTKLQEIYLEKFGKLNTSNVPDFLLGQNTDIESKMVQIEGEWRPIENTLIQRMEKLFGVSLQDDITVYVSTNSRCTYNIPENYFFVFMNSSNANSTILHELLHFYTSVAFQKKLSAKGISMSRYNEIKESLTELLNTDFSDLLGEKSDTGYPQHQEMREIIRRLRKDRKTVDEIIDTLAS